MTSSTVNGGLGSFTYEKAPQSPIVVSFDELALSSSRKNSRTPFRSKRCRCAKLYFADLLASTPSTIAFETRRPSNGGRSNTSCAYLSSRDLNRSALRRSDSKSNVGSTKSCESGKKNFTEPLPQNSVERQIAR